MSTILRFDMRVGPQSPSSTREMIDTSLEMCEWGERTGALTAMFSEHHGSDDGYLPSPLIMAAAAAAPQDADMWLRLIVAQILAGEGKRIRYRYSKYRRDRTFRWRTLDGFAGDVGRRGEGSCPSPRIHGVEELLNEIIGKMLANFLRNIVELRFPESCHRP